MILHGIKDLPCESKKRTHARTQIQFELLEYLICWRSGSCCFKHFSFFLFFFLHVRIIHRYSYEKSNSLNSRSNCESELNICF